MGARIAVQTDRPTRFQILYLCNFVAFALRNANSPRNHIFRPTVAPPWLGRVIRVQNDGLLRGVVQQCISRGECALQIWVNFIPHGRVEHPSSSIFNSGPANVPVVVDLGAVPPPMQFNLFILLFPPYLTSNNHNLRLFFCRTPLIASSQHPSLLRYPTQLTRR